MFCLAILTLILTKHSALGQGEADLTLQDNPGLHAFTYYGAFADDISFGKLIVTIDTKRIMKAVQKAAETMDQKINSTSPFLKLMGRRVLESVTQQQKDSTPWTPSCTKQDNPSGTSWDLRRWGWLATPSTTSNSSGES